MEELSSEHPPRHTRTRTRTLEEVTEALNSPRTSSRLRPLKSQNPINGTRRSQWSANGYYNDAGCPWGYSANPAFRVLEWRYGDQIEWRLVMIGLRDEVSEQMRQQFDPVGVARLMVFRNRYGMPFSLQPKARAASTGRGCRAVVAARLLFPGSDFRVLRALQLANFTTTLLLDDDAQIRNALAELPGIDADAIVDRLDDAEVVAPTIATSPRRATPAEPRSRPRAKRRPPKRASSATPHPRSSSNETSNDSSPAAGNPHSPTTSASQTSTRRSNGHRRPRPPALLDRFPDGLTTAEIAAILAQGPDPIPDLDAAEQAMVKLVADGVAVRGSLGSDPLWLPESEREPKAEHAAAA